MEWEVCITTWALRGTQVRDKPGFEKQKYKKEGPQF